MRLSFSRLSLASGSILIETLVAVVLLAIAIVPLASAIDRARDSAYGLRAQADKIAADMPPTTSDGWDWGPRVIRGEWSTGRRLGLDTGEGASGGFVVGVWTDGWFLGEREPDVDGSLLLPGVLFAGCEGAELVVRVRDTGGAWGPPWRSIVPDQYGNDGLPVMSEVQPQADVDGTDCCGAWSVVHAPNRSSALLTSSSADVAVSTASSALPIFLVPSAPGALWVGLAWDSQGWQAEAERSLDVYY